MEPDHRILEHNRLCKSRIRKQTPTGPNWTWILEGHKPSLQFKRADTVPRSTRRNPAKPPLLFRLLKISSPDPKRRRETQTSQRSKPPLCLPPSNEQPPPPTPNPYNNDPHPPFHLRSTCLASKEVRSRPRHRHLSLSKSMARTRRTPLVPLDPFLHLKKPPLDARSEHLFHHPWPHTSRRAYSALQSRKLYSVF